jgi:hypothetical protein
MKRAVLGKIQPDGSLQVIGASATIPSLRPAEDRTETVCKLHYPDGRIWEVRVHHRYLASGIWCPQCWVRKRKVEDVNHDEVSRRSER